MRRNDVVSGWAMAAELRRRAMNHGARSLLLGGLAVITAACRRPASVSVASDPWDTANAEVLSRVTTMALPEATGALEATGGRVRVVVRASGIDVDNAAVVMARARAGGADVAPAIVRRDVLALQGGTVAAEFKRGGANGFVIEPLRDQLAQLAALEGARSGDAPSTRAGEIEVYVEPDTRTRTVLEVLSTAAQEGYARFYLVMRAPGGSVTAYVLTAPRVGAASHETDVAARAAEPAMRALGPLPGGTSTVRDASRAPGATHAEPAVDARSTPMIRVVATGYQIRIGEQWLRPGCTEVAGVGEPAPMVVSSHDGVLDPHALTACLEALRERSPFRDALRDVRQVEVAAPGEITYGEWLSVFEAARGTRPGERDLFPDGIAAIVP